MYALATYIFTCIYSHTTSLWTTAVCVLLHVYRALFQFGWTGSSMKVKAGDGHATCNNHNMRKPNV